MSFENFYKEYFPFWNKLNDTDRDYLCQNSLVVHFEKEQSVHDNTGCSGLYIVKSGRLLKTMNFSDFCHKNHKNIWST